MPLRHLGYESGDRKPGDVCAMDVIATRLPLSIAVYIRRTPQVGSAQALCEGVHLACQLCKVGFEVGGHNFSQLAGLIIGVARLSVKFQKTVCACRNGAKNNDLLVVTGDLAGARTHGIANFGQEKQVFQANPNTPARLEAYTYLIERQLKPEAGKIWVTLLEEWR